MGGRQRQATFSAIPQGCGQPVCAYHTEAAAYGSPTETPEKPAAQPGDAGDAPFVRDGTQRTLHDDETKTNVKNDKTQQVDLRNGKYRRNSLFRGCSLRLS